MTTHNTTIQSQRTLARNPIAPYPLPGEECVAYNKISWPPSADRVVPLVHDMQNYSRICSPIPPRWWRMFRPC